MSTQKRGDTYYSRIVVPSSLRHIVPRREVVKSLQVQAYPSARLRCAQWEARIFGLFAALETRGQEFSGKEFDAELRKLAEGRDESRKRLYQPIRPHYIHERSASVHPAWQDLRSGG